MAEIQRVGVFGAGFMGSGIAESAARAGLAVAISEPGQDALDRSRKRIETSVGRAVAGGKLSDGDAAALLERITWSPDLDALAPSDVVVEAIVEDEAAKVEAFKRLDAVLDERAILASNTSSIPIAGLAAATGRRDRVLGLHFFSPVPVMKLVEIVVGLDTSEETVARADAFAAQLGKTPIHTKDRSGFIVNFLLVPT